MLNSKTAGTIHAEMMMVRAGGWSGVFVVVEGPDDEGYWRTHLKVNPEAIVIAEGVINLRDCMRALPPPLVGSVCAIADQDFRHYLPVDPFNGCVDVFFYDEGFLETFLLNTSAFQKLLGVHAEHTKLIAFLAAVKHHTVYAHLRDIASVFGRLRVLNEIHKWGICFERKFTVYKYVDETSWVLDERRLITDVALATGLTPVMLKSACDVIGMRGSLRLVHGHDALKVLAIGLKKRLGCARTSQDRLLSDLKLAFDSSCLPRKRLARQLRTWAGTRRLL